MKVESLGEDLKVVGREEIPPDPENMITALRQIGYTLEQSIADLIDNSINAKASRVLIRFIHSKGKIVQVLIADNGTGMNRVGLREAMKFGSKQKRDGKSLGKYGMGLKTASLGYAQTLTVFTKQRRFTGGRRWTVQGISEGWECEDLSAKDVESYLQQPLGNVDISKHGTLLVWSDIDRLTIDKAGVEKTLQKITKTLKLHFGLCFHRFIEDGRLEIRIDDREDGVEDTNICQIVPPINPFGYKVSGNEEFPKVYRAKVPSVGELRLQAHIWPPNAKTLEYKLGGKAAARQGFYFYRNDRLIQPGGWNGIIESETDPHNSLARVVVDMNPDQDREYGLNVQKSAIIVPTSFGDAIKTAKSSDGDTLQDYRAAAQQVYRKDERFHAALPLVPESGLPKNLSNDVREFITGGKGRVRKVSIEWELIQSGEIFALDRRAKKIILNSAYRKEILAGRPASKADIPAFKLLLFFLLEKELDKERESRGSKEWLEMLNKALGEAVDLVKG